MTEGIKISLSCQGDEGCPDRQDPGCRSRVTPVELDRERPWQGCPSDMDRRIRFLQMVGLSALSRTDFSEDRTAHENSIGIAATIYMCMCP